MIDKPVMIVTGTRKSIGKYLAKYYTENGFQVIGCSRGRIDFEYNNYQHYNFDISNESSVKKMFAEIRKKYGRLDVLINNAGITSMNYVLLTPLEELQNIIKTNVVGTFLCCREAVKVMKKNDFGRIINVSSVHIPFAMAGTSCYGASKAWVEQFSKVLSREVFQFGITVNLLSLSIVRDTGMAGKLTEEMKRKILERTISKTELDIKDIYHGIDFYISPNSSLITNQNLYIGGV